MTLAKICGLKTQDAVDAAAEKRARYVGFVFFGPSPRDITPSEVPALTQNLSVETLPTGLFVKQSVKEVLEQSVEAQLRAIQLHGTYTVDQVREIFERRSCDIEEIIMAFSISAAEDFDKVSAYAPYIDRALYDAKPPKGSKLPGGNAVSFDWSLLKDRAHPLPWMLAGGLNPNNVIDAIRLTGAPAVDVSSGVECAAGVKSSALIRSFLDAVADA